MLAVRLLRLAKMCQPTGLAPAFWLSHVFMKLAAKLLISPGFSDLNAMVLLPNILWWHRAMPTLSPAA